METLAVPAHGVWARTRKERRWARVVIVAPRAARACFSASSTRWGRTASTWSRFWAMARSCSTKRPARVNIGLDLDAQQIAKVARHPCDTAASQYQFYVGDGIDYLRRYPFVGDELVFCDPPYLSTARAVLPRTPCRKRSTPTCWTSW